MNPENHYTERLSLTEGQLQQVKKQIFRISMLRLALFIAGIAGLYFFFNQTTLLIICICLTFLPLFILVKIHNRFFIRKEWLETQARIIQEELQALSGDYSSFEDGKEYVNPEHPYSFDLDIFGRRSLFQSINRTCTFSEKPSGKMAAKPSARKTSIEKRQEMVREISEHTLFREQFRVAGLVHHGQSSDGEKYRHGVRVLHNTCTPDG